MTGIDGQIIKEWLCNWRKNNPELFLLEPTADSVKNHFVQVSPWKPGVDPYQGRVHYEVIKRNERWFAEFHVELYKHQGREEIERKINQSYEKGFIRKIGRDSYSANRYWKCRCPILSEQDLQKDFDLLKKLIDGAGIVSADVASSESSRNERVTIKTSSVADILQWELHIPDYQRGYCWDGKNILSLLNDIRDWQRNTSQSDDYRLGTIVVKRREDKKDIYDLIDGQQRLITLGIWKHFASGSGKGTISLGCNNRTNRAKYHLVQAKNHIGKWQQDNGNAALDLSRVEMSVVVISASTSEDIAFRFFIHLNAAGKRLSDYDLLKSHHLRYIQGDDLSMTMANRWNELDSIKEILLHQCLYRIRNWMGGQPFKINADNVESHDLFHSFSMDFKPLEGLYTFQKPFQIDSLLSEGMEFFEYVDRYRALYRRFQEMDCVKELANQFSGHSHGTLWQGIHALAFMFYCKYGDIYLKEAIYSISYRVSELRNEKQVRRTYLSDEPVFSLIARFVARSTHEREFLGKMLNPNECYHIQNNGQTATYYWNALSELAKNLDSALLKNTPWDLIGQLSKPSQDAK